MPVRNNHRYAHTSGQTDVCFSSDGRYLVTCGNDGDVRLWDGFYDDDPTSHCVGEKAYTLAYSENNLYVSTDSNIIQSYSFPSMERNGVVNSFTAPVTHIVISPDGNKIVGGSCDMTVKVYDRTTSNSYTISGHKGPIRGVSVDPELKYVATSSSDGTIRVWSSDTLKCVKIWSCLPISNSFNCGQCLGRTSWFPVSGKYIAVPDNNVIYLYEKDTWIESKSLHTDSVSESYSIAAFSPSGEYLAASTVKGEICVWNVSKNICVSYTRHHRVVPICSLVWNPMDNGIIAFCDTDGQLGIEDIKSHKEEANVVENASIPVFVDVNVAAADDGDDDDDSENVISLEKIKASVSNPVSNPLGHEEDTFKDVDRDDAESKMSSSAAVNLQAPFQPSSTPEHLQHRYMVWNSVGIVRCHNAEEEDNIIEVEFHDSNVHHSMLIPNTTQSSIASLSEEILMLGCKTDDYMKTPSKIQGILIRSWDGTKNWSMDLPDGEDVLTTACTNTWAAVATDVRNLRLFSIMGIQREIVCLPGPIVCMSGYEEMLLVIFYHCSGVNYMLLSVLSNRIQIIIPFQPLPLSPCSTLQWAGFTDEGTPCTMDSAGIVRIFSNRGYWVPICDTGAKCSGSSDHYFILGVSEKYQNLRCILCRGSHYPPTVPRPTVIELSLLLPVCESTSERSELEEKWQRSQIFLELEDCRSSSAEILDIGKEEAEKKINEAVIKLFAMACRSGLEQKAVELCNMMSSFQTVQMALKYASKLGKSHLVERISDIATQKKTDLHSQKATSESVTRRYGSLMFNFGAVRKKVLAADKRKPVDEIDPFAPSQKVELVKENILVSLKEKITSISDTPPSAKLGRINPFKRISKPSNDTEIQKENDNQNADSSLHPVSLKAKETGVQGKPSSTPSATETRVEGKPSNIPTATKTLSFVQWFDKGKVGLKEEFPNLSVSELTRLAMKRFREERAVIPSGSKDLKSAATGSSNGESVKQSPSSDVRKRKVDEVQSNTSASKLAKFAFKK